MDDIIIAGTVDFVEKIKAGIVEVWTVFKVERHKFRFTRWDVEKYQDVVKVSIKDYAQSLKEIEEIRKAITHKTLSRIAIKEYRKFARKLSWLAAGTQSDLS